MVRMRIGQARSSSGRKRRAVAAVLALKIRTKTYFAPSIVTTKYRHEESSAIRGRYFTQLSSEQALRESGSHVSTGNTKHRSRRIVSHKGLPGLGRNTFGTVAFRSEPS